MTEAERERAAVVAWLRQGGIYGVRDSCAWVAADAIERLDHLKEQDRG